MERLNLEEKIKVVKIGKKGVGAYIQSVLGAFLSYKEVVVSAYGMSIGKACVVVAVCLQRSSKLKIGFYKLWINPINGHYIPVLQIGLVYSKNKEEDEKEEEKNV